jgi:dTDP-glucose 4,6-dehydratase
MSTGARRYLVTGGAGFIGSNFIRYLRAAEPDAEILNLDALTYAGVAATVAELDRLPGHRFVHGNIGDAPLVESLMPGIDIVVNFAAETHVDRSITDPGPFLATNVAGTGVLLAAAERGRVTRFIQVSTDEVYGSVPAGLSTEEAALAPSSPYSASKAAADLLAGSYHLTYGTEVVITRSSNNYGPYQFPEKVIPLFVTNLIDGLKVPLYGTGINERDWIHVDDHCAALHLLVDEGAAGEVYNIGSGRTVGNLELTGRILELMGLDRSWIETVPDRPGHDLRYAVDCSKLRGLGWIPTHNLDEGLAETIAWYRSRTDWWRPLKERS